MNPVASQVFFFFLSTEFVHQLSFAHTITVAANVKMAKTKSARRVSKYDSRGPKKHARVFTKKNMQPCRLVSLPPFPQQQKRGVLSSHACTLIGVSRHRTPLTEAAWREERTPWRATAQPYEDDWSLHDSEHSLALLVEKCAGSYFQEWGTCL